MFDQMGEELRRIVVCVILSILAGYYGRILLNAQAAFYICRPQKGDTAWWRCRDSI
jgi:hypothetical protein